MEKLELTTKAKNFLNNYKEGRIHLADLPSLNLIIKVFKQTNSEGEESYEENFDSINLDYRIGLF